ncbi:essential MCU regulator, mitochondrial-like [Antechinus flavipes]|uniref:essential MCU regulator, mitochondrial-like n=1 Tax=Antechinus flavipes TaxID=38775 RepID=UPI0022360B4D|nr:essential MCU regulator, mitochondrial-like [Antechinus flavipes]
MVPVRWLAFALARNWPGQNMMKTWGRPDPKQLPFPSSAYKPSGAIKPPPVIMPFGVLRVLSVMITFFCFGTYISKTFVSFLEEKSFFSLDFDDDDDDF